MQEADLDGDGNINYQGKLNIYLIFYIQIYIIYCFLLIRIYNNDDKTSIK